MNATPGPRKTTVLMVDDEPAILESTRLLLTAMGFEVTATTDPVDALALLRSETPDVLLQDVRIPGLDIDDYVETIRRDPATRNTAIVLFSAALELPLVVGRVDAEGVVEKPFRPDTLVKAIEEALARARGPRGPPPRATGRRS